MIFNDYKYLECNLYTNKIGNIIIAFLLFSMVFYAQNTTSFEKDSQHFQVQYYYSLDQKEWLPLHTRNEIELYNLNNGNHTLKIKTVANTKTTFQEFNFFLKTPFYNSIWAYILYFLVLLVLVLFFRKWLNIKLEQQKKELLIQEKNALEEQAQKYRKNLLIKELEKTKKEKEEIEFQLRNSQIELTKISKKSLDKNTILQNIKNQLLQINKEEINYENTKSINQIKRIIEENLTQEEFFTFELNFDEVNQEFFSKLKKLDSTLNINELRLAAYIKSGLNSKEISDIKKVLPSSINVNRSRLRKKLQLDKEQNLYDFFNSL